MWGPWLAPGSQLCLWHGGSPQEEDEVWEPLKARFILPLNLRLGTEDIQKGMSDDLSVPFLPIASVCTYCMDYGPPTMLLKVKTGYN